MRPLLYGPRQLSLPYRDDQRRLKRALRGHDLRLALELRDRARGQQIVDLVALVMDELRRESAIIYGHWGRWEREQLSGVVYRRLLEIDTSGRSTVGLVSEIARDPEVIETATAGISLLDSNGRPSSILFDVFWLKTIEAISEDIAQGRVIFDRRYNQFLEILARHDELRDWEDLRTCAAALSDPGAGAFFGRRQGAALSAYEAALARWQLLAPRAARPIDAPTFYFRTRQLFIEGLDLGLETMAEMRQHMLLGCLGLIADVLAHGLQLALARPGAISMFAPLKQDAPRERADRQGLLPVPTRADMAAALSDGGELFALGQQEESRLADLRELAALIRRL